MCPYCRVGGVKAPDRAVGWSATCPNCKSSFTIVATETVPASRPGAPPPPPPTREPARPPVEETRPHALADDVTEPSPVLKPEPPEPRPAAAPQAAAAVSAPDAAEMAGDRTAFVIALVALTLFGVGVLASQFPFGRVIGLALCGVGAVGGAVCLGAEGRARLVAVAAAVLNLVAVALLLFAPSWLGLDAWRGAPDAGEPKQVLALGHGTNTVAPADWVDGSRASWGYGDIRVTLVSAVIAPVELTGPNGATRTTKEQYLQLLLRIANTGVERRVELSGWAAGRAEGLRLTDPAGKALKVKTFDPGWEPPSKPKPGGLFPGKNAEVLFVFEPPPPPPNLPRKNETAPRVEFLRLELAGSGVGLEEQPVRFHIPGSILTSRPGPRGI